MRRHELASAGIQLPVLPTIVLGGLPGPAKWAPRLERLGLDVVSSGAPSDTPQTYATAVAAVPHRPVKATGAVPAARIVETRGPAPPGAYRLDPDEVLVAVDGPDDPADANEIARRVLERVGSDPSAWWVGARGLEALSEQDAEARLAALVDGVRHVRLYLAKQQFD